MKTLAYLSLFFALAGHASLPTPNPISRYFTRVPIERAHIVYGSASQESLSEDIKVLVWNVKKGARKDFSSEFVKFGEGKDIFLIQEAFTADFFQESLAYFSNYQWDLGISFRYKRYNNDGTGNMIGSFVRPTWVKVEHTLDYEPVTETPKTTAYAKFRVNNREEEILVISMHGINFKNAGAFMRHLYQVKKHIQDHQGPVILAGDFNTRTKDRYLELAYLTGTLGLTEVVWLNGEIRMTAVGSKNILDHAFVRGFEVKHAEVHESRGSDHKPMTLELHLL
ncbi:MAG: endonuclease/exonuclease/phosphatase family protein [Bdellovibrionota bacterium]